MEHEDDYIGACKNFLKSAKNAERTEVGAQYPNWPAELYRKAILNFIRTYGTIEHAPPDKRSRSGVSYKELIEGGLKKMEDLYFGIKDKSKAYRSLATSYRSLKLNLMEAGNLIEAEQFKRKERSALMHYYFHSRSYIRAIAEWLSGIGFIYFIAGWFVPILFIFPFIYYQWVLITSVQGKVTYPDAILYSIQSALNIGHSEFYVPPYLYLFRQGLNPETFLGARSTIW